MGQHLKDLEPHTVTMSLQVTGSFRILWAVLMLVQAFWSSLIVYYLSLGLTKTSILLQYQRVFTTKRFQIVCWTLMGFVIVYTIWTVFSSIFACVPVRAFWTRESASCINQFAMWLSVSLYPSRHDANTDRLCSTNAGINILTDFALIILPSPVIRSLNLGHRQKIALISIFGLGGL
jgi:hypothetical protein